MKNAPEQHWKFVETISEKSQRERECSEKRSKWAESKVLDLNLQDAEIEILFYFSIFYLQGMI